MNKIGEEMYSLMERLFPICRSITGNGTRETLSIIKEIIPIQITEVPSGTKAFDWEIPYEWNIKDAYIKNSDGQRVIDFRKSNLHIVNYSVPFEGRISLNELEAHLHSLPDQPDCIPYVTSYYEKRWGFCISHKEREKLRDDIYEVKIDSTLQPGSLTYADLVIKGQMNKEILFSTYICHPSMANNELSGLVVSTFLAKYFLQQGKHYYTYRFIFAPETIGVLAYLKEHLDHLKDNVIAGYVITCIGDNGPFSYLKSRKENTLVDRVTTHMLKNTESEYKLYDYIHRGSDERQYCAPGVDLPIGSLMRTKYGEYPEYHTSADNLEFIKPEELEKSLEKYLECINVFENNHIYKTTVIGEPQLGKRGLYPTLSTKSSTQSVKDMMNVLAYCDGENDLLWIAEKINRPISLLVPLVKKLTQRKLLERIR